MSEQVGTRYDETQVMPQWIDANGEKISRTLTVGDLLDALNMVEDKSIPVTFDFCGLATYGLVSGPGQSDATAISWNSETLPMTVEQVMQMITPVDERDDGPVPRDPNQVTWTRSRHEPLYVAQWGEAYQTAIVGTMAYPDRVILRTEYSPKEKPMVVTPDISARRG